MRTQLIHLDVLDAVIGLGPNLFFNASMEACIVVCNYNKDKSRKNNVLFIDAKEDVTRRNGESFLEPDHLNKIIDAYNSVEGIDGFSAIISSSDLLANNSLLNISSYVKNTISNTRISVEEAFNNWKLSSTEASLEINKFLNCLL